MKDWNGNRASVFVCNGATGHSLGEREENDYYATEPRAVELLCDIETFSQNVLEPACGEGHIAKVLESHGYNVTATDLIDRGYGTPHIDFLSRLDPFDGDIITNPPYKYAQDFVEHALALVPDGRKVAMFLKLTFLEGKARRKMFDATPPPSNMGGIVSAAVRKERQFLVVVSHGIRLVRMGQRRKARYGRKMVQLKEDA